MNAKNHRSMINCIILKRIMHQNLFMMMKMNTSMTCYHSSNLEEDVRPKKHGLIVVAQTRALAMVEVAQKGLRQWPQKGTGGGLGRVAAVANKSSRKKEEGRGDA